MDLSFSRLLRILIPVLLIFLSGCTRPLDLGRIVLRNIGYELLHPIQPAPARLEIPARGNPGLHVGMVGHATLFISWGGTFVLTDPNFARRIKIARRVIDLPLRPEEISELDLILISHAHYDHLDRGSLRRLPKGARLLVPSGCLSLVDDLGFSKVKEMSWGEEVVQAGLRVEAFRPVHWGKRNFWQEEKGYNSYLLSRGGKSVLFAGDTGYSEVFGEKGRGRNLLVAFFPISAYQPEWFRRNHATPEEALRMFAESGARYMVPIHWGTFILSHEPLEEPLKRLKAEAGRLGLLERVIILRPGESFTVPD